MGSNQALFASQVAVWCVIEKLLSNLSPWSQAYNLDSPILTLTLPGDVIFSGTGKLLVEQCVPEV